MNSSLALLRSIYISLNVMALPTENVPTPNLKKSLCNGTVIIRLVPCRAVQCSEVVCIVLYSGVVHYGSAV